MTDKTKTVVKKIVEIVIYVLIGAAAATGVGMLGVLAVRHDGTAKVNGYVTVNKDGIATACDIDTKNSYRVIKENSETVVEIIFR